MFAFSFWLTSHTWISCFCCSLFAAPWIGSSAFSILFYISFNMQSRLTLALDSSCFCILDF
jgi:hypothetical protein